jgi:hypothetical protein
VEPVGNVGVRKRFLKPVNFKSVVYFHSFNRGFADISVFFALNPPITLKVSMPVKVKTTVQVKITICPTNGTTYVNATADIMRIVGVVFVSG